MKYLITGIVLFLVLLGVIWFFNKPTEINTHTQSWLIPEGIKSKVITSEGTSVAGYPILWINDSVGNWRAKMEILENTELCMMNCYAVINVTLFEPSKLPTGFDFVELENGKQKNLSFNIYTPSTVDVVEPIYVTTCGTPIIYQGSSYPNCTTFQNGTQVVVKPDWKKYNTWDKVQPVGSYVIKIESKIDEPFKSIDWAFNFMNVSSNEIRYYWATWNSSIALGLYSVYKFDEGTGTQSTDSIRGYNITTKTTSWNATGRNGTGYSPVNEYPVTDYNSSLITKGTGAMTINLWFKRIGDCGSFGEVFGTETSSFSDAGNIELSCHSTSNMYLITSFGSERTLTGQVPDANSWEMWTFTYNGSVGTWYKNGTAISDSGKSPFTAAMTFRNENFRFFGKPSGANNLSSATVTDEVYVWNRSLSASEVSDLWNSGNGIFYTATPTVSLTANQDTIDGLNTTDTTPDLKCNFTSVGQNITSIKINVYNGSNNLDYTDTSTINTASINKTWTTSALQDSPFPYKWSCYGFGSLGVNVSTVNRTFSVDSTPPLIEAFNITSISSTFLPVSSWWYSNITDISSRSCWYYTSENFTNVTMSPCNVPETNRINTTWTSYGIKYINIWSNDSLGNIANKSYFLSISNISVIARVPMDSYKSANPSVTFNCTANYNPASSSVNISIYIDGDANETITSSCGGTCSDLEIQKTVSLAEGNHNWYCKADNNNNGDTAVTSTRSITIDYTNPVVSAINITNISSKLSIPSSTWWVSINDTNRQACWYHTSESPYTNTTISCTASQASAVTTNWGSYGIKSIKVYANDSIGNFNSATYGLTVSNLTASLISPAESIWINTSSVTLSCRADVNPSSNINLSLYVDNVLQETNVTSGTVIYETKTITGLSEGRHTWGCSGADINTGNFDVPSNREFFVDTIYPTVTITTPTGVINYQKPGLLLNLNWTTNDTNPTNCWYNYKGVNNSIVCGLNTTTINTTSYDQRTLTFYANDTVGNIYSTTTSWDYYFWESGRYIPTNIYQTDLANYQLNGSSYNPTLLTATLWTGTSSSSTTRSYTGSNVTFASSSSVPATAGSGTVNVLWSFGSFNTTSTSQTTNAILFGICNASLNTEFLNITFYDESTNTKINATVDASTFEYRVALAGTEYKTFTYANATTNPELNFCFAPADIPIYVDVNFRYSNTGYQRRTWNENDVVLTNTSTQKHLYLFSSVSGQYVNFHTESGLGIPIPDVLVTVSNQILGFTESRYSDDEGVTSFWLNPSDEYTVVATKTGYITKTRNVAPVATDYDIVMQSETETSNITNVCSGLNISFFPNETELANDTVYDFGASVISSEITLTSWGFYVRNASEYIVNQSSSLGNGGSVTIESNTGQSPEVYLDVYVVYGGQTSICARQNYYISNDVGKEYSINHFITDLRRYLDNGSIFGLTNFGLKIIIFVIMLVTLGILVTYYGIENTPIILMGYGIFSFVAFYVFGSAVMPLGVPVLLILGSVAYMIWEWSR